MAMLCAMACVENKILQRAKNMKGLEKYGVVAAKCVNYLQALCNAVHWLVQKQMYWE